MLTNPKHFIPQNLTNPKKFDPPKNVDPKKLFWTPPKNVDPLKNFKIPKRKEMEGRSGGGVMRCVMGGIMG